VSPGGEFHAFAVEVIPFREVERFNEYSLDVADEALGPRLELRLDCCDLRAESFGH
jgi:hypothetical protein